MFSYLLGLVRRFRVRRQQASRVKAPRRPNWPDIVLLEDRVPVSEQIGPFLALSAMSLAGGLSSPLTAPKGKRVEGTIDSSLLVLANRSPGNAGHLPLLDLPPTKAGERTAPAPQTSASDFFLAPGNTPDGLSQDLTALLNVGLNLAPRSTAAGESSGHLGSVTPAAPTPGGSEGSGGGDANRGGFSGDPGGSGPTPSATNVDALQSAAGQVTLSARPVPPPTASSPPSTPRAPLSGGISAPQDEETAAVRASLYRNYGRLPLSFEPNRGQSTGAVQFLSRGHGYKVFLTATQAALILQKPIRPEGAATTAPTTARAVLRFRLVGANDGVQATGRDQLPGKSNYFVGRDPRQWRTGIPNYEKVEFRNVYPNIDLVYYGTNQRQLEYDFVIHPGASVSAIRMEVQGATQRRVTSEGHLILSTPGGEVTHRAPVVYQLLNGVRQAISSSYTLHDAGQIGFQVGAHDAQRPLYVDPVLDYSSYLGGSGDDFGGGVAVDSSGNAYVTGGTLSTDFPVTGGIINDARAGRDVFITKMDATGTRMLYSTYLGGGDVDEGFDIAVDGTGNAFVTGVTRSFDDPGTTPNEHFPTTSGAYKATWSGTENIYYDAFVTKLNATGDGLLYSSLFGGDDDEQGFGIAVNSSGKIVITGETWSSNLPTPNGYQTTKSGSGSYDAFLAQFDPALSGSSSLLYSTYFGGTDNDKAEEVALDSSGKAYIVGHTPSTNLPTASAYQSTYGGGGTDAFVAKFDLTLSGSSSRVYSTYLGGTDADAGYGIAVDSSNNAYVTGETESVDDPGTPSVNEGFPLSSAIQSTFGGISDAFVTKLNTSGNGLVYSTYLGGGSGSGGIGGPDRGNNIAVDSLGNAYVTGSTQSRDNATTTTVNEAFPTTAGAFKTDITNGTQDIQDAFVTYVNAPGTAWRFSTYLGGTRGNSELDQTYDYGNAIALDAEGSVYVAGTTTSIDFPTGTGFQNSPPGGYDAFLAKLDVAPPAPTITTITNDTGTSSSDKLTNDRTLSISGLADPGSTVTLIRNDVGALGTTTAHATTGVWTYDYTGTTLDEGGHVFTATATVASKVSDPSAPFVATVDITAPTVAFLVNTTTYDLTPQVQVAASDLHGVAEGEIVYLAVDADRDGTDLAPFESGELSYATATLQGGQVIFEVPLLTLDTQSPVRPIRMQARVDDKAGNTGNSIIEQVTINAVPSNEAWNTTAYHPQSDPEGEPLLHEGNVHFAHALDLNLAPGSTCGCMMAELVYNSSHTEALPVIQASIQSDNTTALPNDIDLTLTWDIDTSTPGQTVNRNNISLSGRSPGDLITVTIQVPTAVTTTDRYLWNLVVKMDYGSPGSDVTKSVKGVAYVVAHDASPFGAGWTLSVLDRLHDVPLQYYYIGGSQQGSEPAGQLRAFGHGQSRFYQDLGGGSFAKAKKDDGLLSSTGSGSSKVFTFTSPSGRQRRFDDVGRQTRWTSEDGNEKVTFTYDTSGRLETAVHHNSVVATFAYQSGSATISAEGNRTTTLAFDSTSPNPNLQTIVDPAGGLQTFTYSSHRLTNYEFGALRRSWAYGNGMAISLTEGTGADATISFVAPSASVGLTAAGPYNISTATSSGTTATLTTTATHAFTVGQQVTVSGVSVAGYNGTFTVTSVTGTTLTYTTSAPNLSSGTGGTVFRGVGAGPVRGQWTSGLNQAFGVGMNTLGLPLERLAPDGGRWRWTRDSNGHVLTETNPRNYTTTFTRDSTNPSFVTREDLPDGSSRQYVYNSLYQLTKFTNERGYVTTYVYETNNLHLKNVIDALNQTTTYTWTSDGLLQTVTNPRGLVTSFGYDAYRRLEKTVEAYNTVDERTTTVIYDDRGNLLSETRGRPTGSSTLTSHLITTSFAYDALGRRTAVIEAFGTSEARTTTTAYEVTRVVRSITDPLNRVTSFAYDSADRQTRRIEAYGDGGGLERTTTTTYDAAGNVWNLIDPLGRVTSFGYDAANRQKLVVEARGLAEQRVNTNVFDLNGNVIARIDPLGRQTRFTYDSRDRQTTQTEAWGLWLVRTTTTVYDAVSNVQSVTNPRTYVTTYQYDALDRTTQIIEAQGTSVERSTTQIYDLSGNVLSQTTGIASSQAHLLTTSFAYDNLDRRTQTIEAYNDTAVKRTTTTVYDAADNVRRVVDPLNRTTSFGYNALNQTTRVDEAHGSSVQRSTTYLYDAVGNVLSVTNGIASSNPQVVTTSFAYDSLNRQTQVIEAFGETLQRTTTTEYDRVSNVFRVTDPRGNKTELAYDALNRSIVVFEGAGTFAKRQTLTTYDPLDQVIMQTDPLGRMTVFTIDPLGRTAQVTEAYHTALQRATIHYFDANDNLIRVEAPLSRTTSLSYDALDRVTRQDEAFGSSVQRSATYLYDAGNYLLSTTSGIANNNPHVVTTSFGYDTLGRRTQSIEANGISGVQRSATYLYDAADNLLSMTSGISSVSTYERLLTTSFGYDDLDRQIKLIEAWNDAGLKRTTTTVYDAADNVLRVEAPLGRTTSYAYDKLSRVTRVDEASGTADQTSTTFLYDATDNVLSQTSGIATTNPQLIVTSFAYDALNRRTQAIDAWNDASVKRTTTIEYDRADHVLRVTDPLGRRTQYTFDALNRTTAVTEAAGTTLQRTATYLFDTADRLLSVTTGQSLTNPHLSTTSYAYDALDRSTSVITAFGVTGQQRTVTMLYDAADNMLSTTRPQTYDNAGTPVRTTTSFAYDQLNRTTRTIEAWNVSGLERTTTAVYDAADNALRTEAPAGRTTSTSFDTLNRTTRVDEAHGSSVQRSATFLYDAVDRLLSTTAGIASTSPHTVVTSFAYDSLDRRTQTIEAFNDAAVKRTTTVVYDAASNVLATVDPRNHRWTVTYDKLNRAIEQTDPLSHTTSVAYDAVDNVIRTIDALGNRTTFTYDALNRRETMKDPGLGVFTYVHDAADNVVNTIDQVSQKTTFVYDKHNRRTQTTDPRGGITTLAYDAADNLSALTDPVNNTTTFVYDKLNRVTQETDPRNNSSTFAYDAADRQTSKTDRLGRRHDFAYDELDRLKIETWINTGGGTADTLTFTYDAASNLKTAANNASAYTFTYDLLNRVKTEQQPYGLSLTYSYDANNNRTKVEDSLNGVTTSVYDAANRLTEREYGGSGQTRLRLVLTWTNRNELESLTRYRYTTDWVQSGLSTYHYDNAGRLDNLKHRDGGNTLFFNATYGYDAAHRLTSEQENGATAVTFGYYPTDELKTVRDGRTEDYGYDSNGNRNTTGYTVASANRLTAAPGYTFAYDAENNLVSKTNTATGDRWTYSYNHYNQMTGAEKRDSGGNLTTQGTYGYDAYKQRIQKIVDSDGAQSGPAVTERFGYDRGNVWADLNGSSSLTTRRFYLDGLDNVFARIAADGTAAWYSPDRLGSIRNLANETGTLLATYTHDSFGKTTVVSETTGVGDRLKAFGSDWDSEIGQYYNWQRYYDPETGRWTTEDPIRFRAGDANLNRYVGNQPTNATDPSGLQEINPNGLPADSDRLLQELLPSGLKDRLRDVQIEKIQLKLDLWAIKNPGFYTDPRARIFSGYMALFGASWSKEDQSIAWELWRKQHASAEPFPFAIGQDPNNPFVRSKRMKNLDNVLSAERKQREQQRKDEENEKRLAREEWERRFYEEQNEIRNSQEIRRGKTKQQLAIILDTLVYYENAGWVDWGHAQPGVAKAILDALADDKVTRTSPHLKDYSFEGICDASKKIMTTPDRNNWEKEWFVIMVKEPGDFKKDFFLPDEAYLVKRGLTEEERISVGLAIFMHYNEKLERNQGNFPTVIFTRSSFSREDLPSDLIGFYRAVYGWDDRKWLEWYFLGDQLHYYDALRLLAKFDNDLGFDAHKNYKWKPKDDHLLTKWSGHKLNWPFNWIEPAKEGHLWYPLRKWKSDHGAEFFPGP